MQLITRKGTFDSGHRVMNEQYKCYNLHGHTYLVLEPLIVMPLAKGRYNISAFIKAENIESIYRYFTVEVT